jgi:hypothetical protein
VASLFSRKDSTYFGDLVSSSYFFSGNFIRAARDGWASLGAQNLRSVTGISISVLPQWIITPVDKG